jgi:alpha-1,6-mannosyltransferase
MKICDLSQMYSPQGGGVRSYLLEKRKFLRENTSHEHLMIVPGSQTERVEGGRTQIWTVRGPMVNRTSRYRWMMDLPALLRILYAERPDVVESGDPYHAAMVARNWANRRGSKFYMFYHSHFPDALLRTILKFLGPWARSVTEQLAGDYLRRLALSGNGVFVGSRHLIRILGGWGVPRLIHLPLGVDTKIFQPVSPQRKRELRKKLGLALETRVLLYVGRFSPDKDTALLLRAWSSLERKEPSDWIGVMVGGGQMKDEVDGYVRTHPRIRTTPFLKDPAALAEWYQAADLLLHPGRWETFGLVLLEAQACGLPVIAFRGGAMDEQSHDVTHWAAERSSEAFALAVQKRMHRLDDNDRKPLISFIENNFSWDKTFARQLAEYES